MKITALSIMFLFLTGCVTGPIPGSNSWTAELPLISLGTKKVPTKKKMRKLGAIEVKYCVSEHKITTRHGLIDELIKKAKKQKKKARYISNATITSLDNCVRMVGTAVR